MPPKKSWKKLKSKIVYKNPWFRIRQDAVIRPDGKRGTYDVVETLGDSVFVVAMNERDEILFIRLHRYPLGKSSLEIPGGNSEGENILKAAQRELWEETGYRAKSWKRIGTWYPLNGICNESAHVFVAKKLICEGHNHPEEEGISGKVFLPLKKVRQMIRKGQITDGQTLVALLYLLG